MNQFQKNILPLFEEHRADWLERARSVAADMGRRDEGYVTIDMVRAVCPPPEGCDPRVMGAVFQCGKNGPWEKVGYVESKRKACHGRPVAIFRLKSERLVA